MPRVQWSVFLYRDILSWMMTMMWMMVMMVVEVIILKALLFKMSILCGVISAILVVILVIAITMKIRFTFFFYKSLQVSSTILTIFVSRCGRRTEQTWRKDSSSESSFEISSKSPDLLVKDIQGGRRVDDESMNE